jgi:hypothetical protein
MQIEYIPNFEYSRLFFFCNAQANKKPYLDNFTSHEHHPDNCTSQPRPNQDHADDFAS